MEERVYRFTGKAGFPIHCIKVLSGVLQPKRGDFLCAPFTSRGSVSNQSAIRPVGGRRMSVIVCLTPLGVSGAQRSAISWAGDFQSSVVLHPEGECITLSFLHQRVRQPIYPAFESHHQPLRDHHSAA